MTSLQYIFLQNNLLTGALMCKIIMQDHQMSTMSGLGHRSRSLLQVRVVLASCLVTVRSMLDAHCCTFLIPFYCHSQVQKAVLVLVLKCAAH